MHCAVKRTHLDHKAPNHWLCCTAAHCIFHRSSAFLHANLFSGQFSSSPAVSSSGVDNTCQTLPSLLTTTHSTHPSK